MFSNKLPLFICLVFLVFYLSATNDPSDDEDYNRKFKKFKRLDKIYSSEPSSFGCKIDDYVGDEKEFEDEEAEEYEDNNVNTRGEGSSSRPTKGYDERLEQIYECQEKLFGKEQPKNEYNLNYKAQKEIFDYYKNENKDFADEIENYKNLKNHNKKNAPVFLGFLSLYKIYLI